MDTVDRKPAKSLLLLILGAVCLLDAIIKAIITTNIMELGEYKYVKNGMNLQNFLKIWAKDQKIIH